MKKLVDGLVTEGHLRSEFIQEAFSKINRRDFVPENLEREADKNIALPIGLGVQIMQPQKAAFILENMDLEEGQKILCLGSESGWIPNILAEIVGKNGKIIVLDEIAKFTQIAQENSRKYPYLRSERLKFLVGEGRDGFSLEASYDRIVSLVSFLEIPESLKKQLKVGGKMLIPIKNHYLSIERKTLEHFLKDEEIQLRDLKNRSAQKMYQDKL